MHLKVHISSIKKLSHPLASAIALLSIILCLQMIGLSTSPALASSLHVPAETSYLQQMIHNLTQNFILTLNEAFTALKTLPHFLSGKLNKIPIFIKILIFFTFIIFLLYLNHKYFLFTRLGWFFLVIIPFFDLVSIYILYVFLKTDIPTKILIFYFFTWLIFRKFLKSLYHLYAKLKLHILLVKLGAKPFEYTLKIIPLNELNAFAYRDLSGKKYIAITTKTLKSVSTKELHFIVAHELAHHLKNHFIVKVISETFTQGSGLLLKLFRALNLKNIILMIGINILKNALYRKQEYEADELAFKLLYSAGLDPRGGITFLKRMAEKLERSKGKLYKTINLLIGTHPLCKDRVVKLEKLMTNYKNT